MMMAYIVPFTNQAPLKCSKLNSKCNLLVITMKSNTSNLHLLLDSIRALEKYKLFDDVYKANYFENLMNPNMINMIIKIHNQSINLCQYWNLHPFIVAADECFSAVFTGFEYQYFFVASGKHMKDDLS